MASQAKRAPAEEPYDRYLCRGEILAITGVSYPTILSWEAQGKFPKRRQIGPGRVGWLKSEVDEWVRSRPLAQLTGDPEQPEGDHA